MEEVAARPPDLILLDVMMPCMDGLRPTHIPVVMVTTIQEMEAGVLSLLKAP